MAVLKQAIYSLLIADVPLMALLPGGLHDTRTTGQSKLILSNPALTNDAGQLKTFAAITWGEAIPAPSGGNFTEVQTTFTVWLYTRDDSGVLDSIGGALKRLLHRKRLEADDASVVDIRWVSDGAEFIDTDLGGANGSYARFQVTYLRQ